MAATRIRHLGVIPPAGGRALTRVLAILAVSFSAAACLRAPAAPAGPFAAFVPFAGREIEEVHFAGDLAVPEDSLRSILVTRPSTCAFLFLPVCPFGIGRSEERLDVTELARDVERIRLFYRSFGFYGTRVVPDVDPTRGDGVIVHFAVLPGDRVATRAIEVEGVEGILPAEPLRERLPLRVGEPFGLDEFLASADSVEAALLSRGYLYAEVLRGYDVDTIADFAAARYVAVPGPLVRVDTVIVLGADRLDRRTVLGRLTVNEGEVLVASELNRSQRHLYELGIVSFASVQLAPDSLQLEADSALATVIVRVVEGPRYIPEAAVGYGTLDCFRARARLTDRHFLGEPRELDVTAAVSKIGTGAPLSAGLESNLCRALEDDRFSDTLNYRVAVALTQPRIFGTRTSTALGLQAERASEVGRFLRVARGGRLSFAREVASATLATTTLNIERARTSAAEEIFCLLLQACGLREVERLQNVARWSNVLSASLARDRTDYRTVPVAGYQARISGDWATGLLGSDDRYLRGLADVSGYHEVRQGWVLAARLMGGAFLERVGSESGFIPPERLFYGGGPNTVRGVDRNALGPALYITRDTLRPGDPGFGGFEELTVRTAATGGTRIAVASLELRLPGPFWEDRLRLAAFVDAGRVWRPEDRVPQDVTAPWRVTPGLGARFLSPVGPIRVDIGYNPYPPEPGPLYGFEAGTGDLVLLQERFNPDRGGFLDRLHFYLSLGQPF